MNPKTHSCKLAAAAVLSALTLLGCGGGGGDGSGDESNSASLTPWTPCANNGQQCSFEGTHIVRYGRENRYETAVFTDGVLCAAESFGASSVPGARCSFDASAVGEPDGGAPTDTHSAHDHDHTGDDVAGAPEGEGGAPAEPHDHEDPSSADPGTAAHDHSGGPYIDESAIPTGFEGFDTVRIMPTGEQPSPSDGTGSFRNVCQFSHMDFDDPIVFPGQPGASHLHTFFGNTGTNAFSTHESLRESGNSTCRGGIANRSSYWVPALIDGDGLPQAPTEVHVYYKTGYAGLAPESIQKFPEGLRMIGGDPKATAEQPNGYWDCFENSIGHPATIPECPVGQHVSMHVRFPQCWDGENLDSADHRSHMAYPSDGSCPASHPVPIPELSYTVNYLVPPEGTAAWRLASDGYDESLPGGYSAHGDWFEGWDPDVAEAFVKNCDNKIVDCHSHLLGDGREIY